MHRRATPRGLLVPHMCATSPKPSATFRREDRASALSFSLLPVAPSHSLVHHGRRVKLQRHHVSLLRSSAGQAKSATASAFVFSLTLTTLPAFARTALLHHRRSCASVRHACAWPSHYRPPRAMLKPCTGAHGPPGPPRHSTAAVDDHGRPEPRVRPLPVLPS